MTNAVTEVVVGAGARARPLHACSARATRAFHVGAVAAAQARRQPLRARTPSSLGAALSRTDIATRLDGAGRRAARSTASTWPAARSTSTTTPPSTTRQPRGTSRELYKGILDGRATGVFNGKVFVRPDAQKTDAQQTNQNLLLSDDAQVDTKPQLEIFADDVKCSHGATVGQLDDDAALLPARPRHRRGRRARALLIYAFATEVIDAHRGRAAARAQLEALLGSARAAVAASGGRRDEHDCRRARTAPRRGDRHATRRPRRPASTSSGSAPTSRSCTSRCTASRSSTSTTPPPRRSRARSSTRVARFYADRQRQHPPRRPHAQPARHRRLRGGARRGARLPQRRRPQGDHLHPRHHRGHQPGGAELRPRATLSPGDEILISAMEHHSNIVPWQMVCRERGAVLRVDPDQRRRRARSSTPTSSCSARAPGWSRVAHVSNALGTVNPVRADDRARPRARHPGAGRRRPGGAAPAGRRAGARLRLLRLLRPQALRPDRHRRALRQGRAARRDAALPGRRRHDQRRDLREDHLQRPARQVRGRHAEHRRRRRPRRRDRLRRRRRPRRRSPPTSTSCSTYATARLARAPAGAPHRHGAREGRRALLRHRRRPPARHRHHPRPRGHRRPHRPPLRPAGHAALRVPATARASFAFYNTTAEVDALVAGLRKVIEVFA